MSVNETIIPTVDSELQKIIEEGAQQHRFRSQANLLTDACWDICMDKPSTRLDGKTEYCLVNCVERFIDTNWFILSRYEVLAKGSQSE